MATAAAKGKPVFVKVDQLKPGTAGHTLVAKVLSSKTVLQKGRPGAVAGPAARPTKIAECLIGDETGCILFTARNEQGTFGSFVCLHVPLLDTWQMGAIVRLEKLVAISLVQ
jgi:hypothetical protein